MRYGCRDPHESSSTLPPLNHAPARAAEKTKRKQDDSNRKARKAGKRARPRDKETRRDAAKEAAKRHHKKEVLCKTNRTDYSFVYVGNIDPAIAESRLREYFSTCGQVCRVQLRCSRGQAVSIGVTVPENVRTTRDRQYASIEFQDYRGARNALRLNGSVLDGCELVVTITPADLPEVKDIVDSRLSEIKSRDPHNLAPNSVPRATARPLRTQPTEQAIDESHSSRKDRFQMFGLSFGKCVA